MPIAGDNPLLLEPLLHDPATRKTNFVLLHGGWPYIGEITALLQNPNVYTDFSEQTMNNYPREVSSTIRKWLEYEPEKVLFATDAYPFSKRLQENCAAAKRKWSWYYLDTTAPAV